MGDIFFRFGPERALSASVICIGIPTAAIGFPTYETAGIAATSMMILVRMLQGLSMGGALTGSHLSLNIYRKNQSGFILVFPCPVFYVGILFGLLVSYLIKTNFYTRTI